MRGAGSAIPLLLLSQYAVLTSGFSAYQSMKKSLAVGAANKAALMAPGPAKRGIDRNALVMMPSQVPMVPYKPPGSDYAQFIDIYSRMYRDRTVMISQFLDEETANNFISILLWLRKEDPRGEITLYLNIPGALLRPALALYDVINNAKMSCPVGTVNLGLCTGMGALLAGAGTKGMRASMPNARFLLQRTGIEEPVQGQASDIALEVANMKKWNDRMETELARMTGQPVQKVQSDMKRDFYLSSEEAVQYGLIDHVLLPSPQKRATQGKAVDLGAFEGEKEQRYQGQENRGGWGSSDAGRRQKKDDDDGPQIQKGG